MLQKTYISEQKKYILMQTVIFFGHKKVLAVNARLFPKKISIKKPQHKVRERLILKLVGEGGFEPPKLEATDLQSAPFGHSGTLPCNIQNKIYQKNS